MPVYSQQSQVGSLQCRVTIEYRVPVPSLEPVEVSHSEGAFAGVLWHRARKVLDCDMAFPLGDNRDVTLQYMSLWQRSGCDRDVTLQDMSVWQRCGCDRDVIETELWETLSWYTDWDLIVLEVLLGQRWDKNRYVTVLYIWHVQHMWARQICDYAKNLTATKMWPRQGFDSARCKAYIDIWPRQRCD